MKSTPELRSIEAFGDFLLADDRTEFTFDEACALAKALGQPAPVYVIRGLKALGFTMQPREVPKHVRGFQSNSHDRWSGPGSCPTHGGSGWEQIAGFAGQEG
jgi:hypothetical protein